MPTLRSLILGVLPVVSGCGSPNHGEDLTAVDADDPTPTVPSNTEPMPSACGSDWSTVSIATEDGETLAADWKTAPEPNRGVVVLFHMIPPHYDRTHFPLHVRDAFAATGVAVLNVDRRGAGDSTGTAIDAYEGPGGVRDVEAAVDFAYHTARGCTADPASLVFIGASNGTTSIYDYTYTDRDDLPAAASLVFMSPGTYTENQHALPSQPEKRPVDLSFPILWLYPENEPYSDNFVPNAPEAWRFVKQGDQHGTNMFDGGSLETSTIAEVTTWIETNQSSHSP